jgi:cobalt/nickel transport system permease protein
MHIPDGFLSAEVAAACAVPAAGAVAYGLRRASRELDERRVPLLGVTAAFVFAAQMLNFPVAGGTSGHFLGASLAAILLGPWLACLVLSVVLVVQSFVFADGGVTALPCARSSSRSPAPSRSTPSCRRCSACTR